MSEDYDFLSAAYLTQVLAVDTETNGKDVRDGRGFCIGISLAFRIGNNIHSRYFPVAHTEGNIDDGMLDYLFQLLENHPCLVMHNAKFDLVSLKTAGFKGKIKRWYCTMLMAHMLNENLPSKALDWLAKNVLEREGKKKSPLWILMHSIYGWSPDFPAGVMAEYAGEDAVIALELYEFLHPLFVKEGFDGNTL